MKNLLKRLVALSLCAVFSFSLVACGTEEIKVNPEIEAIFGREEMDLTDYEGKTELTEEDLDKGFDKQFMVYALIGDAYRTNSSAMVKSVITKTGASRAVAISLLQASESILYTIADLDIYPVEAWLTNTSNLGINVATLLYGLWLDDMIIDEDYWYTEEFYYEVEWIGYFLSLLADYDFYDSLVEFTAYVDQIADYEVILRELFDEILADELDEEDIEEFEKKVEEEETKEPEEVKEETKEETEPEEVEPTEQVEEQTEGEGEQQQEEAPAEETNPEEEPAA